MSKITMYNNPQEWLKKPLLVRLEELRKENCTGPCGQSNSTMSKRTCESQTLIETMALIATIKDLLEKVSLQK
jgi:hypothetical protein